MSSWPPCQDSRVRRGGRPGLSEPPARVRAIRACRPTRPCRPARATLRQIGAVDSVRKRHACLHSIIVPAMNNIRVLFTQRHNHRERPVGGVGSAAQYLSRNNECFVPLLSRHILVYVYGAGDGGWHDDRNEKGWKGNLDSPTTLDFASR
jgi:hypothetical protein